MTDYTLYDPIFVAAILSGLEGMEHIDHNSAYLIGGGAIQFYTFSPTLVRPTLDADIQTRDALPKFLRLQWGQAALDQLKKRGYQGSYRKARSGAEIKLALSEGKLPFFLHLDVYTQTYAQQHRQEVEEAFERRRPLLLEGRIEGIPYSIQAPEDLLSNKLKRPLYAIQRQRLCPEDVDIVHAVAAGCLDDVDVGDLEERLQDTMTLRNMGMEEITRHGFEHATKLFDRYKDQKDIYDILVLIASDRQNKIFEDSRIIRSNVQQYLPDLTHFNEG